MGQSPTKEPDKTEKVETRSMTTERQRRPDYSIRELHSSQISTPISHTSASSSGEAIYKRRYYVEDQHLEQLFIEKTKYKPIDVNQTREHKLITRVPLNLSSHEKGNRGSVLDKAVDIGQKKVERGSVNSKYSDADKLSSAKQLDLKPEEHLRLFHSSTYNKQNEFEKATDPRQRNIASVPLMKSTPVSRYTKVPDETAHLKQNNADLLHSKELKSKTSGPLVFSNSSMDSKPVLDKGTCLEQQKATSQYTEKRVCVQNDTHISTEKIYPGQSKTDSFPSHEIKVKSNERSVLSNQSTRDHHQTTNSSSDITKINGKEYKRPHLYKQDDCKPKCEKTEGPAVDMKLASKVACKEKPPEKSLKDLSNPSSMSKGKTVLVIPPIIETSKKKLDTTNKNSKIVEKGYENMFWTENSQRNESRDLSDNSKRTDLHFCEKTIEMNHSLDEIQRRLDLLDCTRRTRQRSEDRDDCVFLLDTHQKDQKVSFESSRPKTKTSSQNEIEWTDKIMNISKKLEEIAITKNISCSEERTDTISVDGNETKELPVKYRMSEAKLAKSQGIKDDKSENTIESKIDYPTTKRSDLAILKRYKTTEGEPIKKRSEDNSCQMQKPLMVMEKEEKNTDECSLYDGASGITKDKDSKTEKYYPRIGTRSSRTVMECEIKEPVNTSPLIVPKNRIRGITSSDMRANLLTYHNENLNEKDLKHETTTYGHDDKRFGFDSVPEKVKCKQVMQTENKHLCKNTGFLKETEPKPKSKGNNSEKIGEAEIKKPVIDSTKYSVMKKEKIDIDVKNPKLSITTSGEKMEEVMKCELDTLHSDRRNPLARNNTCDCSQQEKTVSDKQGKPNMEFEKVIYDAMKTQKDSLTVQNVESNSIRNNTEMKEMKEIEIKHPEKRRSELSNTAQKSFLLDADAHGYKTEILTNTDKKDSLKMHQNCNDQRMTDNKDISNQKQLLRGQIACKNVGEVESNVERIKTEITEKPKNICKESKRKYPSKSSRMKKDLSKEMDGMVPRNIPTVKTPLPKLSHSAADDRYKVEEMDVVTYTLTVWKHIEEETDFLAHLVGIVTDTRFQIISLKNDSNTDTTTAMIRFKSNGDVKKFQSCLRNNNDKLLFQYHFQREGLSTMKFKIITKKSQYIQERTLNVLGSHQEKQRDAERKLSGLSKVPKNKFIGLAVYEQREAQKKALSDKLEELKRQQTEFQLCLSDIIQQVESYKAGNIGPKEFDSVMNKFEVECSRLEQALPIYAKRTEIIDTILQNQVSIILGETGSGKSTQITQYILESVISSSGKIICTQPRKVAAMSLAQRVASELKSNVGDLVGYQVGMKSKLSNHTKVLYMTDHMLLNECLKDPLLMNYSCVVIDEAHERSVYTDLLLGMIKKCLPHRPELHVIITSATIDPEVFVRYFGGPEICPVLKVSGRMFPVEIEWLKISCGPEVADEYEIKAIEKAAEIHKSEPPGDILVFLTSQVEIEHCAEKLEALLRGKRDHWILPLHGKLQTDEQNLVFKCAPKGRRKIVLATNVAETSVTIPGIKYVVDTGAVKELSYDPRKKVSALRIVKVTKSSADQRKGRAGRTGPGKCYRIYSQEDYDAMFPTSIPEIQKIHLGHAILKLLQLDVDPLEFDFVQAPEKISMENAFQHLTKLGAIEDGKIAPLGRWIAKLPFEPNLGVLVHDSIDHNVGLEGIIIAASCTVSGSLFYRGGTKEQKETSDKLKVPFCHKHGDHFTNLNVFKEWNAVHEKQKGKWCRDNSINGKAMRSIRDCANEILHILKKDLDIHIKFEFTDSNVERILQRLLFRSFQNNLCHYLGHEKAGYYFIDKSQQVIMHPSSAFQSLASFPKWVIVERVMQTSRDFALNITAVADEDVEQALIEGSLDFDIEDVESRRVAPILTEYVGVHGHREFVGPRYSKVRAMQENLSAKCTDSVFVIDADRDKGEISIFAPVSTKYISTCTLKTAIDPIKERIRSETVEHPVLSDFQNVRISIGAGGQTKELLYQEEYKNVFIFGDADGFGSNDKIKQWFERFGTIQSFIKKSPKNTNPSYLGQIIYEKSECAKAAVNATRGKRFELSAKPPKGMNKSEEADLLKARLTWCRRKSRGFGFVEIHNQDVMDQIIICSKLNNLVVGGKRVNVRRGKNEKNPNELFVSGLGELVNEDVLRESFFNRFDISENDIGKVAVIREKVNTRQDMLYTFQSRLEVCFKKYLKQDMFFVTVVEPKPADFTYQAFVTFKDPEEGFEACSNLKNNFFIGENAVSIIPEIQTRLFVLAPVYVRVQKEIEEYCEKIKKEDGGRRITITHLKNDNFVIDIDADSIESMVHTRNKIQKKLEGETIDLEQIPTLRFLFTRDGQAKVGKIMEKTNTLILLDHRNTSLSVHGKPLERNMAVRKIRKYIEKLSSSKLRIYDLKGETKPPGLMKAVILMHGVDLKGLKDLSDLSTVELDHRSHRIRMLGSDEAVDKAVKEIDELMNQLREKCNIPKSNQPECGICLCEITETDIYRLESCGHPYCRDCIKMNIESAIQSKDFPLKCCHDGCKMLWAWKDFVNMTKQGYCSLQNIITSSLSCFVRENKEKARYCITPDCPMVYKVSATGGRIVCGVCRVGMCSKCHVEYHNGMSCAMYQMENGNDESGLREWMRRDPNNRKLCPNCFAGIEKTGGCQHMECRDCKVHICWTCMKFFKSGPECYGHMDKEHGSFM